MGVTLFVGGQKGGEGKSKVLDFYNVTEQYDAIIQTNGKVSKADIPMQIFPRLVPITNLDEFLEDIKSTPIQHMKIDQYCMVYSSDQGPRRAADVPELVSLVDDVQNLIYYMTSNDASIAVEGSYGYELSYQYTKSSNTTNMDTSAASIVAQCGISISDVEDIILVYNIAENDIDISLMREGIMVTDPSTIVLNGLDTVDENVELNSVDLTDNQLKFIEDIETPLGVGIDYVGNGPDTMLSVEEIRAENGILDDYNSAVSFADELDQFAKEFQNMNVDRN